MIRKLTAVILIIAICFAGCASNVTSGDNATKNNASAEYYNGLFDTSYVHTVDITISEENWKDLTENPLNKTKYETSVTIDGETLESVSFATKGNTSLSTVASDEDSDRYSFKINFGKFVEGQTYHGLDKLNLNNIYADATYMKDFISYTIFNRAGVDSPLVSYIWLTINGKDAGLYIGIEDIGESYLERTGSSDAELYKPETEQLDNANADKQPQNGQAPEMNGDFGGMPQGEAPNMSSGSDNSTSSDEADGENNQMPGGGNMPPFGENGSTQSPGNNGNMTPPDISGDMQMPSNNGDMELPSDMQGDFGNANGAPGGGMDQNDKGASLKYTDDELDSYSDIFDNAETDVTDEDKQRVVESLKKLSNGDTSGIDTDEIIRYFAAHNFVMNYDSYTGNMLHNYYLYENSGSLGILPWDYNLAFGTFMNQSQGSSDSSDAINMGIDTPLSGTTEEDRPMWAWITENEEYTQQYHKIYDELLSSFFESGECEKLMEDTYNMIRPYVEKDPTAFYTVDEFDAAYVMLKNFISLRTESIRKQLDGNLSTITEEQNDEDKVDASSIDISVMGSHSGGKGNPMENKSRDNAETESTVLEETVKAETDTTEESSQTGA